MTPAPERKKLAGLTFATVDEKLETTLVAGHKIARETRLEHRLNLVFTLLLLATVIALWIYFA